MDSALVQLRLKAGITQKKLAEALGVSNQTITNWERGYAEATFTFKQIKTLCALLKVGLEDLPDQTKTEDTQHMNMNANTEITHKEAHLFAKRRKALGFTQQNIADLIGIGSRSVQCWEAGEHTPHLSPEQFADLCDALNCSIRELANDFENVSK